MIVRRGSRILLLKKDNADSGVKASGAWACTRSLVSSTSGAYKWELFRHADGRFASYRYIDTTQWRNTRLCVREQSKISWESVQPVTGEKTRRSFRGLPRGLELVELSVLERSSIRGLYWLMPPGIIELVTSPSGKGFVSCFESWYVNVVSRSLFILHNDQKSKVKCTPWDMEKEVTQMFPVIRNFQARNERWSNQWKLLFRSDKLCPRPCHFLRRFSGTSSPEYVKHELA